MLKAVSLNAEDTSEGTMPAVFVDSDKDRANLNKPPEYDQIRRLLHSASLSNRDKSGGVPKFRNTITTINSPPLYNQNDHTKGTY